MPTIAEQILQAHFTARSVRRAAQARCTSMTRKHRHDKDRYWFGDRSGITVVRSTTYIS